MVILILLNRTLFQAAGIVKMVIVLWFGVYLLPLAVNGIRAVE